LFEGVSPWQAMRRTLHLIDESEASDNEPPQPVNSGSTVQSLYQDMSYVAAGIVFLHMIFIVTRHL
jgi:hypothetical protein